MTVVFFATLILIFLSSGISIPRYSHPLPSVYSLKYVKYTRQIVATRESYVTM
jgi:hypothetical protein